MITPLITLYETSAECVYIVSRGARGSPARSTKRREKKECSTYGATRERESAGMRMRCTNVRTQLNVE